MQSKSHTAHFTITLTAAFLLALAFCGLQAPAVAQAGDQPPQTETTLYLPLLTGGSAAPAPETIELLGPFNNNGGFESQDMLQWMEMDGTFDITDATTHSGDWAVQGTEAAAAWFYRDVAVGAYTPWIASGQAHVAVAAQLGTGDGAEFKFAVRFFDAEGTELGEAAYSTGWQHGTEGWERYAAQRAIPGGTHRIRVEIHAQRHGGTYTAVHVDDVTLRVAIAP